MSPLTQGLNYRSACDKACDGRTDYGIAVVYTCYIIGIGLLSRVKTSNITNLKKAFRHAGRLFETARLRQTKSSYYYYDCCRV